MDPWELQRGVALGNGVAEITLGTLEGSDPQDRVQQGWEGTLGGDTGTAEPKHHMELAFCHSLFAACAGVALGAPIPQSSGSSASSSFPSL